VASRTLDVAAAAALLTAGAVVATSGLARRRLGPVAHLLARPPGLAAPLQAGYWLDRLADRGSAARLRLVEQLAHDLDRWLPAMLQQTLHRIDLTALVLENVDLDRIITQVDIDAVVGRVDVDAVARRLDLDAVAALLDVDAVAARLDVDGVLDRVDLTAVVLNRVDLHQLMEAVLEQLDVVAVAQQVIDGVDLPEIIRESSGAMASDTVRGARVRGIAADDALGRIMRHLLLRRGADGGPDGLTGEAAGEMPQGV
jgi:hypothetical protein